MRSAIGIGIVLAIVVGFVWTMATYAEEAKGTSVNRSQSLENAYISAHFKCNRKGLWADLVTLRVIDRSTRRYTIAGGTKKITEHQTTVSFECTPDYKRTPEAE